MARLHTGINGPVSGKIGNLVYYTIKGKCFVRRAPKKTKKALTLKQKIQRKKFGTATLFASPVAKLVNQSYKLINRKKMGVNVLIRDILNEAIIGQYPKFEIDYSKVDLVRGNLPWSFGSLTQIEIYGDLKLSWQIMAEGDYLEDELIIMIYCCTAKKWLFAVGAAQRAEGACNLRIDAPIDGDRAQVWILFRSRDHKAYSSSQFLGEVITHNAPSYEN